MGVRSRQRETCHGTSDNVVVPIDDFTAAIDGAIRLARNFDGGLIECGLVCPADIIAMDSRLRPYYKVSDPHARSVDTSFPCR